MVVTAVAVGIVVPLLLLWLFRVSSCQNRRLPPSPLGLPILGHLHYVLGKLPHVSLYNLSRKHGPLLWLKLGQQPVIVASSPAAARHVLQIQDNIFATRPRLQVPVHLHDCADILFASPMDAHWKFLRQICASQLFSKKRLETLCALRMQEVRVVLRTIHASAGTPVACRDLSHMLTGNIMCRMVFGRRLRDLVSTAAGTHANLSHHILDLMSEMNHLLGVFNLADHFPCLANLDIQGYGRQTRHLARKFDLAFEQVIENHPCHSRRDARGGVDDVEFGLDFLTLLLQAASPDDGTPQLSYANIKAVLMNMFGGGVDTAALTIESALGELLANPSKMRILRGELEQVVGMDRLVEESDLSSLPYLQAVVKETMRLHPVAPLLIPHIASKACEVMGYQIPANTISYVNAWAIGRDPSVWESPFDFCPERFVDSAIDVKGKHFELLPFGSGRRGCPGWMLGLVMVQIGLASLVQAFDWELAKQLDFSEAGGLLFTASNPLIVKATPKVAHLLQIDEVCVN